MSCFYHLCGLDYLNQQLTSQLRIADKNQQSETPLSSFVDFRIKIRYLRSVIRVDCFQKFLLSNKVANYAAALLDKLIHQHMERLDPKEARDVVDLFLIEHKKQSFSFEVS